MITYCLGATYFYIYVQSVTVEVKEIIDFYEKDGIEIQIVNWSSFPLPNGGENANDLSYR